METKFIEEVRKRVNPKFLELKSAPRPGAADRAHDRRAMIGAAMENVSVPAANAVVSFGNELNYQSTAPLAPPVFSTPTWHGVLIGYAIWEMINAIAAGFPFNCFSSLASGRFNQLDLIPPGATGTPVQGINQCMGAMVVEYKAGRPEAVPYALVWFMKQWGLSDPNLEALWMDYLQALKYALISSTMTTTERIFMEMILSDLVGSQRQKVSAWAQWANKVLNGVLETPPDDFDAVVNDLKKAFDAVPSTYVDAYKR